MMHFVAAYEGDAATERKLRKKEKQVIRPTMQKGKGDALKTEHDVAAKRALDGIAEAPGSKDISGLAASGTRCQKSKRKSEGRDHKGQLAALQETDPEFYKYLLETDKDLLEFQTGDSESEGEEDFEVSAKCALCDFKLWRGPIISV